MVDSFQCLPHSSLSEPDFATVVKISIKVIQAILSTTGAEEYIFMQHFPHEKTQANFENKCMFVV